MAIGLVTRYAGTKSGVRLFRADTVIAMGLFSWWERHRIRTVTSKVMSVVVPFCAVVGFLLAAAAACSGSTPHDDEPLKNFSAQATATFLRATNDDPGRLSEYFPSIDPAAIDLPPRPEGVLSVRPGQPEPRGTGVWMVPVSVATSNGGEAWQLLVSERVDGGQTRFAGLQLPSPWPGESLDTDIPANNPQDLKDDNPARKAAADFLTAWMTGDKDVGRYTTSGDVAPEWPQRPYTSVDVVAVRAAGTPPGEAKGSATVTADVIVSGRHDRQVSYRLQLKAVNGQWMVAAINPA